MPTPRPTPLVIFDCDGVLIDSEEIGCGAMSAELDACGYAIAGDEIMRRFAGMPERDILVIVERELGRPLPADISARILARVLAAYRTDLQAVAGVAETLRALSLPFCVASSGTPSKLAGGLIATGLFDLFYPHVFSTVLVARGKPAPDIFLYAARALGAAPGACAVVEDSVAGITAARAAGMHALGFTGGAHCTPDHADRLRQAGAHAIVDRFTLLPAVLEEVLGPVS